MDLYLYICVFVFVLQTHSNETVGSVRWKISEHLSCPVDNVQIFANDSVVSVNDFVSNLMFHFNSFYYFNLSFPHQSILLLVFPLKPVSTTTYKSMLIHVNLPGNGATASSLSRPTAFIVWQGKHNLNPCSSLTPSLHYPSATC